MLYLDIKYIILVLILVFAILFPYYKLTRLEEVLLNINLDSGWSAGYNVECSTGNGKENKSTTVKTSHCSCLIYYVCNQFGIYIPSPPEYSQFHLADRQLEWLSSNDGIKQGWKDIGETLPGIYEEAQKKANEGYLVIVGITHDDRVNGHICIVRPYRNVDYNIIKKRGPIVIASSSPNTYADYLDDEFRLKYKDYEHLNGRIKFFYYSKEKFN
jgi:hypothetical protein